MTTRVSQHDLDTQWNEVVDEINVQLAQEINGVIEKRIEAPPEQAKQILQEIRGMVVKACIEEHWADRLQLRDRPFRRMYRWLAHGRLPCGANGAYPSQTLRVL